ncbi:hypothetical protein Deba_2888 [Desulfarculus baarsii DSM 2075]|uniref:Uncharacterized protein n=1 Tax=Desulfarculus baarsii (strain ATCC 33931 / DSM 2075 / LMG 7858 / VKM B-1802 / 2st14) TaxID=644282 RepID=E1QKN2_DESB2|nr:hypothetical protein [Desulfarculus baarsii]ADK86241.1 hypothetical protein Deba_2888 [Desulfarculus baarsii DSM 2075]
MQPGVFEEVLALLRDDRPPTRNRSLARFSGAEGLRLWRMYKLYGALLRQAQAAEELRAHRGPGVLRLELRDRRLAYRRVSDVPPALQPFFIERLGLDRQP